MQKELEGRFANKPSHNNWHLTLTETMWVPYSMNVMCIINLSLSLSLALWLSLSLSLSLSLRVSLSLSQGLSLSLSGSLSLSLSLSGSLSRSLALSLSLSRSLALSLSLSLPFKPNMYMTRVVEVKAFLHCAMKHRVLRPPTPNYYYRVSMQTSQLAVGFNSTMHSTRTQYIYIL